MSIEHQTMKAMVLVEAGRALEEKSLPIPKPMPGEVLVRVDVCAVCRTDLHVVDGDLPNPKRPLILGHQIVGTVVLCGENAQSFSPGDRVGIPWLGRTCGRCRYCLSDRENLCDAPGFTGYTLDGGYAEYAVADERYCFPLPSDYSVEQAAPLLCAGLIGFRALRMAGDAERLGFYGFGAAAHILVQLATFQGREVYAFTRKGDREAQDFALDLGAVWAGDSETSPPRLLDAALIFAPVGALVPKALRDLAKGGIVVCAGIHMSDIPSFPYHILWEERSIRSVANLTRDDGRAFFELAPRVPVRTSVQLYPLTEANRALDDLRHGRVKGSAVLDCRRI